MSLSITQHAQPEGRNHWSWWVALSGTPQELDDVEWVEYTLHPTFSPPVHRVTDRASSFRLEGSGWGEFMIHVTVCHRGGAEATLQHWLELGAPPRFGASAPSRSGQKVGVAPPAAGAPAPGNSPAQKRTPRGGSREAPRAAPNVAAPQRCAVFVSSGLADRPVARRVEELLKARQVEVFTGEDMQSVTDSIDTMIRQQLEQVDGAVFLVSNRQTPWLRQEIAGATELDLPVAVVHTGGTWPVPGELEKMAGLTMDLPSSATDGAELEQLLAWAQALPVRAKRPGARPAV